MARKFVQLKHTTPLPLPSGDAVSFAVEKAPIALRSALPPMAVEVQGKLYPVETYAEASKMVEAALAEYHGWYRDLPEIGFYEGKRKTGHVSTNGKVWLRRDGRDYQVWPPRADVAPLTVEQPPPGTSAAALAAKIV